MTTFRSPFYASLTRRLTNEVLAEVEARLDTTETPDLDEALEELLSDTHSLRFVDLSHERPLTRAAGETAMEVLAQRTDAELSLLWLGTDGPDATGAERAFPSREVMASHVAEACADALVRRATFRWKHSRAPWGIGDA